jgi:hypothetical protein
VNPETRNPNLPALEPEASNGLLWRLAAPARALYMVRLDPQRC